MRSGRIRLRLRQRGHHELEQPPARPAGWHIRPDPAVGGAPPAGPGGAHLDQPERMAEHGGQRRQLVDGRGQPLGEQEERDPQHRYADVAGRGGHHLAERQVAEQGQQAVAPVQHPGPAPQGDCPAVLGRRLNVVHDRVGDYPDPVAGGVHPPAEVDVVHEQAHGRVEPADLLPDVAADQHPGAADREGVPVAVVLALVDLARLDAGQPPGRGVQGQPGLQDRVAA